MNLSTLLLLLRHIPEAEELADSGAALAATPELVRFDAALTAFQAAMGAKVAVVAPVAPTTDLEGPAPYAGEHGSSIYTGSNAIK